MTVEDAFGTEVSPRQCEQFTILLPDPAYLLAPMDEEIVRTETPFFQWTPLQLPLDFQLSLVLQIVEGGFTPVGHFNPTIPADVQAIVGKMVHNERNQRFQSAEDLVHALKKADTRPMTKEIRAHVPLSAAPTAPEATEVAPPP